MAKKLKTIEVTEVPAISPLETAIVNVSAENKAAIKTSFQSFLDESAEWKAKADALVITSEDQIAEMKEARTARLALVKIRTAADKTRKDLKDESTKYGNAVQAAYNLIKATIEPIEAHLEKQEKFAEVARLKRETELASERSKLLVQYAAFAPRGLPLGTMSVEDFEMALNGAKLLFDADKKQKAEAEELRKALEASEKEKADQLAALLEQARKEEREKSEKEKAELREKAEKDKAEAVEQAKQSVTAPAMVYPTAPAPEMPAPVSKFEQTFADIANSDNDKDKLTALAELFAQVELPEMETEKGRAIMANVAILQGRMVNYINEKSAAL